MADSLVRFAPPSSRTLLAHLVEDRELVAAIQGLEPRVLARLIDHVGLEDAGELIALATTDQLARVFDEDLWKSERPGVDETFDPARFILWLEVMLEAGSAFTARRFAELPEDLVVHALHQHLLVIDLDALAVEMAELGDDGEPIEKALEGCLYHELDQYRVMARRADGWDAIVTLLVALDEQHHELLARILERCCALSERDVEDGGGLYQVLTSEEMLAGDVAADREDRRAREGFIAPSQAAAFLRLAAITELSAARTAGRDPVTRAYFRELGASRPPPAASSAARLAALLRDVGVVDEPRGPAALPSPEHGASAATDAAFRAALVALLDRDPVVHGQRMAELAYLANVLVAGADAGGRSFRPAEAAAAALTTCGLGLAHLAERGAAVDVLVDQPADTLFRLGWRILHERTGDPARALLGLSITPPARRR